MKYSIEEIREITNKANKKATKRFEMWKKKRIEKENNQALNIIKKINKKICISAKKGITQAFLDVGCITDEQKEIIRDYFELRMYNIRFNEFGFYKDTMIWVDWKKEKSDETI